MLRTGLKRAGIKLAFGWRLLAGVVALNAAVVGIVSLSLYKSNQQFRSQASTNTQNLSKALAETLVGIIGKVDLTLLTAVDEVERETASGGIDRHCFEGFLERQVLRVPEILGLRMSNVLGDNEFAVGDVTFEHTNVADREFFKSLRDDLGIGLYLTSPVLGRTSGKWVIILSRRRTAPDGIFSGEIHASVEMTRLTKAFSGLEIGPKGSVTLWDKSSRMVLRYTEGRWQDVVDNPVSASADLHALLDSGAAEAPLHSRSGIDGRLLTSYMRRLGDYPLTLAVSLADDDFLADWRREAALMGGMTALFAVLTSGAALMLYRSQRRRVAATRALANRELELSANLTRYRLLLRTATDGIHVLDVQGNLVECSDSFLSMLGYTPEEAAGLNLIDWDLDATLEDWQRASLRLSAETVEFERRHRRRDGEVIDVQLSARGIDIDGDRYVYASARDITQRKIAEKRTQRFLAFRQAILEAAGNAIIATDLQGVITLFNPTAERWLGYGAEELVGRHTPELFHSAAELEARSKVLTAELGRPVGTDIMAAIAKAAHLGGHDVNEWTYIRKDGTTFPVMLSVSALHDEANQPIGFLGVAQDISASQAMEIELKRSNAELEEFAYVASHDLRQPLRQVSAYVSLLSRGYGAQLGGEAQEFLNFARAGAEKMDRLIIELLDYSRIGRKARPFVDVSLAVVVGDAVNNLGVAISDLGAKVTVDLPGDLPKVEADEVQMIRLFQNIIGNAIKYKSMDRVPEVRVTARRNGAGMILVSVEDNGIGINPQHFERIFGVFQRLHGQEEYEGTGIGLAACKKIVEFHKGRIWLDSVEGKGSTFHVTLPIWGLGARAIG